MPDGKNSPGILNMFSHNYNFTYMFFLFANLIKASDCSLVM